MLIVCDLFGEQIIHYDHELNVIKVTNVGFMPVGVTLIDGNIIVSEWIGQLIHGYSPEMEELWSFDPGFTPFMIATDGTNLVILDSGTDTLIWFDKEHKEIKRAGIGFDCNGLEMAGGVIFHTSAEDNTLKEYNMEVERTKTSDLPFEPRGIAINHSNILIMDADVARIVTFDSELNFIGAHAVAYTSYAMTCY